MCGMIIEMIAAGAPALDNDKDAPKGTLCYHHLVSNMYEQVYILFGY